MAKFTQTELVRLALEARGEKFVPERTTVNYDAYTRKYARAADGELVTRPETAEPIYWFVSRVGFGLRIGTMASKTTGTTLKLKRKLVLEGRRAVGENVPPLGEG